jgi:hypothetical protein
MAEDVQAAAERLRHEFHEDEASPLMLPEEDDQIRDDVLLLCKAYLALAAEVRAVLALCDCHNKGLSDLNTVDGDMAKAIGRLRAAVGEEAAR